MGFGFVLPLVGLEICFLSQTWEVLALGCGPLASLGGSPRLCQVLCGPGGFGVLVSPAFQ